MIFVLMLIVLIILIYLCKYERRSNESIPFVKEGYFPFIGHLFILINNRTKHLQKLNQIYGNVFQMKLFKQKIIFVTNPSDWSIIHRNQSLQFLGDLFSKRIFDMDHNFFGKSNFDAQLQKYFHQFLINPIQLDELNHRFLEYLFEYLNKEKENFRENQSIQLHLFQFSFDLLFYSITKTFYGNVQIESIKDHYRIFDLNIQYLFLLFPQWIYQILFPNVLKSRNQLNKYWLNQIHLENQSQFVENRTNLIVNNKEFFSEKDYSGEKTFLLWSSLSNTIPTLFWSLCHLLNNRNIFQIIQNEIQFHFHDDNQINLSKLRSCKYLDSLINETLRFYSNPMIMRRASKHLQLNLHDGKRIDIDKDDIIALYPHLAQNHHKYFTNPDQFQFDRFVNEKAENVQGFLPFGSGQSMCPGRFFAKNVIQISIITFLQLVHIDFEHFITIPIVNQQRQGIGISHPQNDVTFSFKFK